jgi:putative membrane protein
VTTAEGSGGVAWLRGNVLVTTAVLSVVSLALVFAVALQVGPVGAIPAAPDAVIDAIPHLNAVLSLAAIGTILGGVRAIRRGNVARHRRFMLTTFGLFAAFLVAYLYKVGVAGTTSFGGPAALETYVYYPVLAVHVLLAIVCVPLVYYVLLLAASRPVSELPTTNHPRVGRVAASLWLVSFALGTVVYVMLYWLFPA